MRGSRVAAAPAHLLADSTACGIALSESHRLEAVAFADALAFAAVLGGFAIVLTFAGRYAIAMNLGFFGYYHSA
jgi:hypothetical protein